MTESTSPVTPEPEANEAAPQAVPQEPLPEGSPSVDRIKVRLSLAAKRIATCTSTLAEQAEKIERICLSQGAQYYVGFKKFFQSELENLRHLSQMKASVPEQEEPLLEDEDDDEDEDVVDDDETDFEASEKDL